MFQVPGVKQIEPTHLNCYMYILPTKEKALLKHVVFQNKYSTYNLQLL